jgi:acyl carrier protein phosphodiesterase
MNYLAHAYLSFHVPEILVGNMISDFVKGRSRFGYTVGVQQGITLHRQIDDFTDTHAATHQAKTIFRPHYRLYSGALVDVVYDHFLANDPEVFTEASLHRFAASVYQTLEQYHVQLPSSFLLMLPYMKAENWLYNYRTREGIGRGIRGLVRRSAYLTDYQTALNLLNEHYQFLESCYQGFIKDVKTFAEDQLRQLDR